MLQKLINIFFFISFFNIEIFNVPLSTVSKFMLLFIIGILLVNSLLTTNKAEKISTKKNNFTFKLTLYSLSIWLMLGYLSLLWSKDVYEGLTLMSNVAFLVGILIMMEMAIKSRKSFNSLISVTSVAIIVHNCIGWYEIITKNYYFAPPEYVQVYSMRGFPVSTFFNTNNYATFLALSFFILYINFEIQRRIVSKVITIVTMLSTIILIVNTDSRGSLGSILIGLLIILIFRIINSNLNKRQVAMSYLIISLCSILILYSFANYFDSIQGLFVKQKNLESNTIRINLIKNGLYFLKETNFIGVGAGSLDYWMLNRSKHATDGVLKMHNFWIEILTTYGVLVFLTFVYSFVNTIRYYFVLCLKKGSKVNKDCIGFLGLSIAFVMASMSPSSLFLTSWVWIFLALIYYGTKIINLNDEDIKY